MLSHSAGSLRGILPQSPPGQLQVSLLLEWGRTLTPGPLKLTMWRGHLWGWMQAAPPGSCALGSLGSWMPPNQNLHPAFDWVPQTLILPLVSPEPKAHQMWTLPAVVPPTLHYKNGLLLLHWTETVGTYAGLDLKFPWQWHDTVERQGQREGQGAQHCNRTGKACTYTVRCMSQQNSIYTAFQWMKTSKYRRPSPGQQAAR